MKNVYNRITKDIVLAFYFKHVFEIKIKRGRAVYYAPIMYNSDTNCIFMKTSTIFNLFGPYGSEILEGECFSRFNIASVNKSLIKILKSNGSA